MRSPSSCHKASSSRHGPPQDHLHFQHPHTHQQQQQVPLVINTKFDPPMQHSNNNNNNNNIQNYNTVSAPLPPASSSSNNNLNSKEQQQTTAQLADFAAHMVCYLLFGHKGSSSSSTRNTCTPPTSIPASPSHHKGYSRHHHPSSLSCPCEICTLTDSSAYRSIHAAASTGSESPLAPSGSVPSAASSTSWNPQHNHPYRHPQQSTSSTRTHRRILSESDIVQPRPMFRKFCLDVLSATLLSPSVILLSLKYIQQLMINLKDNNKTPSTGEGSEFRLFTGALILANKFLDDNTFTNRTWANITGITVKEVNYIELQFLQGIGFRLFTRSYDYSEWLASLTHFTGKYMPSQYFVAFQQQTVAALSPISPMDPTTSSETALPTPETVAGDLMLSTPPPIMQQHQDRRSAYGSASVGGPTSQRQGQGIDQSSYRSETPISLSAGGAAGPVGAATGSILPHYTNSAKQTLRRPSSGYLLQRVAPPPDLMTTIATTLPHSATTSATPSSSSTSFYQTQSHLATMEYRQQHSSTYMGSYQGSSAPSSSTWSSPSASSTPYSYQQHPHQSRYLETPSQPAPRKRSATIAFDEIMDRSPGYESTGSAAASQLNLHTSTPVSGVSHKRVSSSSSMVHMMGELSTGAPTMFQAGYSPVQQTSRVSNRHQQHLTQATATVPSQRVSTGTMPAPYRGQHHRNASGSHCINISGYLSFAREPAHMAAVPSQAGKMHPLDQENDRQSVYRSSPSFYLPSQQQHHPHSAATGSYHEYSATTATTATTAVRTPPYYSSPSQEYHYQQQQQHHRSSGHFYVPEYRDVEMRGMAAGSSPYYEIDPRFWAPLDNLSLYAMSTQAAKRVFAQSKALAASTNHLSAYYPTTPA
ncbi:cyclin-domain-containing protein [Linnemannia elongata]|nr:cyclin-domain-containing protein [Linnemannia elongata]